MRGVRGIHTRTHTVSRRWVWRSSLRLGGVTDIMETDECIILNPDKAAEPLPATVIWGTIYNQRGCVWERESRNSIEHLAQEHFGRGGGVYCIPCALETAACGKNKPSCLMIKPKGFQFISFRWFALRRARENGTEFWPTTLPGGKKPLNYIIDGLTL